MLLRLLSLLAVLACVACSPSLNWREVDGAGGQRWWFPCKPDRVERSVMLSPGRSVPSQLAACDSEGASWSTLAMAFPDPAQAATALSTARGTLMMNLRAQERMTPASAASAPVADTLWLNGQRADGAPVLVAARWQVRGVWLVQQVVIVPGAQDPDWPRLLDGRALLTFFEGAFAAP